MSKTITTIMFLAMVLTTAVQGQSLPRGRRGKSIPRGTPSDERSPSMSRSAYPQWHRENDTRTDPSSRSVSPAVRHSPKTHDSSLRRPGTGTVPSGTRHDDRGKQRDLIPAPGSGKDPWKSLSLPQKPQPIVLKDRHSTGQSHSDNRSKRRRSIYEPPSRDIDRPDRYHSNWDRKKPFTSDWFRKHVPSDRHKNFYPWYLDRRGHRDINWWVRVKIDTLSNWLRYRWPRPIYYDYGPEGNIYFNNGIVYIDGRRHCPVDEYYRGAVAIAGNVPNLDPVTAARLDWQPLGVFAVRLRGIQLTSTYLQLAVTREGWIGGTYLNQTSGITHPVVGSVDQRTQRTAWTFADGYNPGLVFETSFYNLTRDYAPILVHYGPGRNQELILIRAEAP